MVNRPGFSSMINGSSFQSYFATPQFSAISLCKFQQLRVKSPIVASLQRPSPRLTSDAENKDQRVPKGKGSGQRFIMH
jgi:hypothetical protein